MTGNYKIIRKYRKFTTMTSAETIHGARNSLESFTGKRGRFFIHYPGYALRQEPDGPPSKWNPTGILTEPATPEEAEIIKAYKQGTPPIGSNLDKDFERQEQAANKEKTKCLREYGRSPEHSTVTGKVGASERKEVFTDKWTPGRHNENQHRPGGNRHVQGHKVKGGYRTTPSKDSDDL